MKFKPLSIVFTIFAIIAWPFMLNSMLGGVEAAITTADPYMFTMLLTSVIMLPLSLVTTAWKILWKLPLFKQLAQWYKNKREVKKEAKKEIKVSKTKNKILDRKEKKELLKQFKREMKYLPLKQEEEKEQENEKIN